MRNPFFIPERWVRFIMNDELCVGRTYLHDRTDPDELFYHLVSYIMPNGDSGVISFYECFDIKYVRLAYEEAKLIELRLKDDPLTLETMVDLVIDPNISRQRTIELAKGQQNQKN